MTKDLLYQVAITLIPDVGAITAKSLVKHCGSLEAVFHARPKDLLLVPGVGDLTIPKILDPLVLERAERELELLQENDIQILYFDDETYPQKLKHYRDSPIVLFAKGKVQFNHQRVIAIVGTRRPSAHGIAACQSLIASLQPYQAVILSGMAYGIDICAHQSALQCDLPTWAVIAHGHKYIYPVSHRSIMDQIMHRDGASISEYSFSTRAEKEFFPMRNRIVAGLCDALVVIETAKRGGSMITAHLANNYHKDVFAIPGRVNDLKSQGCNHLIKTHKAALLEQADDLAYILGWEENDNKAGIQQELLFELSEEEKIIVDLLRIETVLSIDQMNYRLPRLGNQLSSHLLNLEFQGIVKSLPGKRYTLLK